MKGLRNMYKDPLGQICEEILDMLTYIAKFSELSLRYTYLHVSYALEDIWLTLRKAHNEVYFFFCRAWNHLYWKYIYEHLCLCGLVPELTDEDVAKMYDRLRLKIADTQYDYDPKVLASKAEAQALLDTYDKK